MLSSRMTSKYTASDAFFESLWEAGIRYCFVNLGSDHPSLVEAILKGQQERPNEFPKIITCPNEMVALAMADGYARWSGKPQAVIVHVDVGTQGLGAAVHDASMGRAPVFIFAGLSPFTIEGEVRGSRTEYIHWIQDVPDQKQIVAQYCRYTGEVKSGRNIKQMVNRALSFAMSAPQGPVYLVGAREVMEEEIEPYKLNQQHWSPVEPAALPPSGVTRISQALAAAKQPLLLVGSTGRNHATVAALTHLADLVPSITVLDTGGSDMCFPSTHPAWLGHRYGNHESIRTADVILVLECDVPWIPTQCAPRADALIFHIDTDPLKQLMPVFYIAAAARFRADSLAAITQLIDGLQPFSADLATRSTERQARLDAYNERISAIKALDAPSANGTFDAAYLTARLRELCPSDTIWVIESVTSGAAVADQLQAHLPGSWVNCGGGGLGWSGGAALGVRLAVTDASSAASNDDTEQARKKGFICQIVGDGTYLFSVPSSVHWIGRRYGLAVLTVVLDNNGWRAPRRSALLVHPEGRASRASCADINIAFDPCPDYAGIAKAAAGGQLYAGRAADVDTLAKVLREAIDSVKNGTSAVVDAQLDGSDGKYTEPAA